MRNVLFLALAVPMLALALGTTQPMTVLPADAGKPATAETHGLRQSPVDMVPLVGTIDTIGGTTYDWWANGSRWPSIVNSPDYGIHAQWMYSAELTGTTYTDRNMRYNFYDYMTSAWNWIDPDFMQSGVNVYAERSGYGNLGADPATGVAIIGRHGGATIHPSAARDIAPGAGIFEYAEGTPAMDNIQWPPLAVGQGGTIHVFGMTAAYAFGYSNITTWPDFAPMVSTGFDPGTSFPTHAIAASKVSPKVLTCWTDNGTPVELAYMRLSEDAGTTWGTTEQLPAPAAFGGDTVTSFHITSLFPFYDQMDRLHILANVMPVVRDTGYIIPAEIWHWIDGTWTKIHRAGCDPLNLGGGVGYNAMYACRPSMGEDNRGNLFVCWEQFDSANVEPVTGFIRADIFAAASDDNGATWKPAVKLTDAGTHSCRFPSMVDVIANEDVAILYELDLTAGFSVQSEHPGENNYVLVQHLLPTDLGVGIAEGPNAVPTRTELSVTPNPIGSRALISYAVPHSGNVSLVVYDAAGRPVQTLVSGQRAAGRYTATLNAAKMASGVYFYTLSSGKTSVSKKLTVTH